MAYWRKALVAGAVMARLLAASSPWAVPGAVQATVDRSPSRMAPTLQRRVSTLADYSLRVSVVVADLRTAAAEFIPSVVAAAPVAPVAGLLLTTRVL